MGRVVLEVETRLEFLMEVAEKDVQYFGELFCVCTNNEFIDEKIHHKLKPFELISVCDKSSKVKVSFVFVEVNYLQGNM